MNLYILNLYINNYNVLFYVLYIYTHSIFIENIIMKLIGESDNVIMSRFPEWKQNAEVRIYEGKIFDLQDYFSINIWAIIRVVIIYYYLYNNIFNLISILNKMLNIY